MNKPDGKTILFFFSGVTLFLWLLSKSSFSIITDDPLRSTSQVFSLLGLLLMMISLILSTRKRFIEDVFGGLDRVYEIHHVVGSLSFILLINHPLLLVVKAIPSPVGMAQYLLPGDFLPYNLGIFALYFMILAFIFMIFIRLPYHIWKRTHQFLGIAGILGGIHALLITSDISVYMPLRIWMVFWIGSGIISFIYIFLYYNALGAIYAYEIIRIERFLDIINIYAKPVNRKISFMPGQFAYVGFNNPSIGREQHPYSFSSGPDDEELRFSIKMVGDYTVRLPLLKEGDKMYIKGPYGKFGDMYIDGKKPLVWIVGGIGITPFLSMLHYQSQLVDERAILLYYCFSTKEEGVFIDEIQKLVQEKKSIQVFPWCSQEKGRLSVDGIIDILGKYDDYDVQICGPGLMMESLKDQFEAIGLDDKRIRFEAFEMI